MSTQKTDLWWDFEAEAKSGSKRHGLCGVGKLLEVFGSVSGRSELGDNAAPALVSALANPDITSPGILKALQVRLDVSWDLPSVATIQRHRKGICSCPRQ